MGQAQLITTLILIGIFSVAIITFATNFATDNDAAFSIADDSELSALSTQNSNNITGFRDASESQYDAVGENLLDTDSGVLQSARTLSGTIGNSWSVFYNVLKVGFSKITGNASGFNFFFVGFLSVVFFLIGLFIYKALRGIPD